MAPSGPGGLQRALTIGEPAFVPFPPSFLFHAERNLLADTSGLHCQFVASPTASRSKSLGEAPALHGGLLSPSAIEEFTAKSSAASSEAEPLGNPMEPVTMPDPFPSAAPAPPPISPFLSMPDSATQEVLCGEQQQGAQSEPSPSSTGTSSFEGMYTLASSLSTMTSVLPNSSTVSSSSAGCPPHGVKAVIGKRPKMEDAYFVSTNFIAIPANCNGENTDDKFPARIAMQLKGPVLESTALGAGPEDGAALSTPMSPSGRSPPPDPEDSVDTLHFFGVYDGHGGAQAANHCAARLHQHLSEALTLVQQQMAAATTLKQSHGSVTSDGAAGSLDAVDGADEHKSADVPDVPTPPLAPPPGEVLTLPSLGSDGGQASNASGIASTDPAASPHVHEGDAIVDTGGSVPALEASHSALSIESGSASVTAAAAASDRCLREDALVEEALKVQGSFSPDSACVDIERSGIGNVKLFIPHLSPFGPLPLQDAFLRTDEEFASDCCASMVGTTAIVALLGKKKIWIANCGGWGMVVAALAREKHQATPERLCAGEGSASSCQTIISQRERMKQ